MLGQQCSLVKPGGRVVFSNCSLDPLEGEAVIAALLGTHDDIALDPIQPGEVDGIDAFLAPQGTLRTTPADLDLGTASLSGLDGFFAARFRRHA